MTATRMELSAALRDSIAQVEERIRESAERVGRDPREVTLVGVSKTVGRDVIDAAYDAGLRDFGENRVQDARAKFAENVPPDVRLHLIGSLQTNKVRQILDICWMLHSVDRLSLIEELEHRFAQYGRTLDVLVQVNVAREAQKHGCVVEDIERVTEAVLASDHLRLRGYMTMAPLVATIDEARPIFAEMRAIRDRMQVRYRDADLSHLSMGMTNDFPAAIEEGATIVRVGRAIFADHRVV